MTKLKTMSEALKLYLLDTENTESLVVNDTFSDGEDGWMIKEGEFHRVTIDTNADHSTGLDGDILVDAYGSYTGGVAFKEINIPEYSEVIFEWYLQNDRLSADDELEDEEEFDPDLHKNYFIFYIDGIKKAELIRPTPWERIKPIGLAPGKHVLSFEYFVGLDNDPYKKKAVFNNFQIWQSERMFCKIREYKPPVAESDLGESKTLRGYTRFQEMTESDTLISFQAIVYAENFIKFQRNMNKIFYFVDEFGIVYRGIFRSKTSGNIALASVYSFDLEFISDSKVGYGFC